MTEKQFTVEEMQNWNKRYKLSLDALKVIDTYDGGEYWTVHSNEAYNLCIDINRLHDEKEQLQKEKHNWLQQKARYEQQYTEYIKENKNLKAQLYSDDEEGICNSCKYHYLIKDEDSELGYYNSRCRKGHYECARMSLKYCNDFDINIKKSD